MSHISEFPEEVRKITQRQKRQRFGFVDQGILIHTPTDN